MFGIGKAISKTFAEMGAVVHILELNVDAGLRTAEEIEAKQKKAYSHPCDVSNQDQVDAVLQQINHNGNGIDILINNAGIAHVGNIENTAGQDLDKLYSVNIKGVYHCSKSVIPLFREKGGGVIINIASIASTVAVSERFAYSMTKGAVLAMTYSIAKDYLKDHIRCNSISPARIHTPFVDGFIAQNYPGREKEMFQALAKTQPIGRMGTPQEVADLALFLCSEEATFITGTDFPIDGGFIKLQG